MVNVSINTKNFNYEGKNFYIEKTNFEEITGVSLCRGFNLVSEKTGAAKFFKFNSANSTDGFVYEYIYKCDDLPDINLIVGNQF